MLSRPGPLPTGPAWSFELKWDGFRALVSTEDGLRVRSRRGWNMTPVIPELRGLPSGLVLDGELVAWRESEPYFPLVCRRVLNRDMSVPLTFVIFDLLRQKGVDLTTRPYSERRRSAAHAARGGGDPAPPRQTRALCAPAAESAAHVQTPAWARRPRP